MSNTFVVLDLSGATFADGSTLSGTWTAEYDDNGNLIDVIDPNLSVRSADGTLQTTYTASNGATGSNGSYQFFSQGNGGGFGNLYLDWSGETPTTLSGTGSNYTSIVNPSGAVETLASTGSVSNVTNAITSNITGAKFLDGSTLTGTWTAIYDPSGILVGVENASFTVTGPQGSTTFTDAGTLPYADAPSSNSFEIHFQSTTDNGGGYQSLYIDWKSENPSSFYEGTPSLYTSVVNTSSGSNTPVRLSDDGTTGQGSTAVISGLPANETGNDAAGLSLFNGVTVTDSGAGSLSATITLNDANGSTDDNGSVSGTGVTRIGVGTYQIAAATPDQLTADLQSVTFTPTQGEVTPGSTVTSHVQLSINDSDGSASAATDVVVTATCFLPGTLIATPHGERTVETLEAGELVTVVVDGRLEARKIVWTGSGRMNVDPDDQGDEGFPVRVRAGAFGSGLPRRDLLVTPEHSFFIENGLVPIRMLVNQASILVDRSFPDYAFFHIELDRHSILLAEGLPTESYLDSGNREVFDEASAGNRLYAARRPATMAAPLLTSREQVEPMWRRLRDYAMAMGLAVPTAHSPVERDPELRVLLDDGCTIEPCTLQRDRHVFRIPGGRQAMRLLSNSAIPAQVVGPFLDDRRRLGVAVDRIVVRDDQDEYELPVAYMNLAGWHALEQDRRWTNGNATLDMPQAEKDILLDIRVVGVMEHAA